MMMSQFKAFLGVACAYSSKINVSGDSDGERWPWEKLYRFYWFSRYLLRDQTVFNSKSSPLPKIYKLYNLHFEKAFLFKKKSQTQNIFHLQHPSLFAIQAPCD